MRILLWGNAPWCPSGYGEQISLLTPRLQKLGHEVGIASNYGLQHRIVPWTPEDGDPVPVFPIIGTNDSSTIPHYADFFQPDIIIALMDAWPLNPDVWPDDFRVAVWSPVDHEPIPPKVLRVLMHEKVTPIAMSRFGETWMKRMELDPLYAPHAVDTNLFRYQPDVRDAVRDGMNIPRDAFLIGMVAANKGWNPQLSRKAFPQAMEAFARFAVEHEDAWFYAHTDPTSGGGTNLEILAAALEAKYGGRGMMVGPNARVRFPAKKEMLLGLPRELMAAQYNAFSVLLNPSMGEGFGVPVVEAQACGVPVIVSDHSAMTELCGAGWLVNGDPFWDGLQDSFAFMPHIDSIHDALESAYAWKGDNPSKAVEFAQQYDADIVVEQYWAPILEQLVERMTKPREVPPLNGKTRKRQRKREAAERRAQAKA